MLMMNGMIFAAQNFINQNNMTNIVKTTVHLSQIRQGDTVEYQGQLYTVSGPDVPKYGFMGYSFRGDASKQTITKVQFAVPTSSGIELR